jgi:hypothetical protein
MTTEWRCYTCGQLLEVCTVLVPARKGARRRTAEGPGLVCPAHGALAYTGPEPHASDRQR